MFRTITLKLGIEDRESYLSLMKQYSSIFNEIVEWAFKNKTYNKSKCHKEMYQQLRFKYSKIPSAMIQTSRDVALEACKRSKFKTKLPIKKNYSSIRYDKRTITLRDHQITFSTLNKREKQIIKIPDYFKNIFETWKFCGATICYINKKKQFVINLNFKTKPPQIGNNTDQTKIVGIDRGLYNVATLSDGTIFNGKEIRKQQRKYLYNRSKLQAKGTPSAKRILRRLSGKEKRFSKNFNHIITKKIVNMNYNCFVLEDLKSIRKQKSYSKKFNKWISSWPFYQFDTFLNYKAEMLGKSVVKINPKYTSQKCFCCGYLDRKNRSKLKFKCVKCGHQDHSDINTALNIKQKYILSVTFKKFTEQVAVKQPNISTAVIN